MKMLKILVICIAVVVMNGSAYAGTLTLDGFDYYINKYSTDRAGTSGVGYVGDSQFACGNTNPHQGTSYYHFRGFSEFSLAPWYAISASNNITGITFTADYHNSAPTSYPCWEIDMFGMKSAYEDGTYSSNAANFEDSIGTFAARFSSPGRSYPQYIPTLTFDATWVTIDDISAGRPYTGIAMKDYWETYNLDNDAWFYNPSLRIEYEPIETPVPEPATMSLFGIGSAAMAFARRKKRI